MKYEFLQHWLNKNYTEFDSSLYEFIKKVLNRKIVFSDIDPRLLWGARSVESVIKKYEDIISGKRPLSVDFSGFNCLHIIVYFKYSFKKNKKLEKLEFYNKENFTEILTKAMLITYMVSEFTEFSAPSIEETVLRVAQQYEYLLLDRYRQHPKYHRKLPEQFFENFINHPNPLNIVDFYLPIKWLKKIDKKDRQVIDEKAHFAIKKMVKGYEKYLETKKFSNSEFKKRFDKWKKEYRLIY